jgi:hypothetical protein
MQRRILLASLASAALSPSALAQPTPADRFTKLARFRSSFARQGIAVDEGFVYPVTDRDIARLEKATGRQVGQREGPREGPILHLDSGLVLEGRLYAAHSNYPQEPMTSSVEIWDVARMEHVGTHSFGIQWGSLTWLDRHDDAWWAVFANYSRVFGASQRPYGNTHWTTLVRMDERWRAEQAWIFPQPMLRRAEPMSISGGSWGPDGLLWCTGHDHPEIYALRLPRAGSVLELVATVPMSGKGQGIAWDRTRPGTLWCISRSRGEAIGLRYEAA